MIYLSEIYLTDNNIKSCKLVRREVPFYLCVIKSETLLEEITVVSALE